jgi:putative oxidoreductase
MSPSLINLIMSKHMQTLTPYFNTIGRVLISAIFLLSGISKVSAYAATQGYMAAMGVPGEALPLVIAFEIGASVAIIIGLQTRLVALALAGFSLATALLFHAELSDQTQFIMFTKNIAIAGGFLFLVANGPGALALDNRNAS